jgi:N-acetylmuramoyl-L-alanine amidase
MTIDNGVVKQIGGDLSVDGISYREDIGTLKIAKQVGQILSEKHEVFFSRVDEYCAGVYLPQILGGTKWQRLTWSDYKWITRYAAHVKADALVSIHTNASSEGGASGIVGFYASPCGLDIAEDVCLGIELASHHHLNLRQIRRKRFAVYGNITAACLIECCYHDNFSDLSYLLSPRGIPEIAAGIAAGLDRFLTK